MKTINTVVATGTFVVVTISNVTCLAVMARSAIAP